MVNKWIEALKIYNRNKGMWCLPKKGTKEYKKVMDIMNNMVKQEKKPKTKQKNKSKNKSKIEQSEKQLTNREKNDIEKEKIKKNLINELKKAPLDNDIYNKFLENIENLRMIQNKVFHKRGDKRNLTILKKNLASLLTYVENYTLKIEILRLIEKYVERYEQEYEEMDFEDQIEYTLNKLPVDKLNNHFNNNFNGL